MVTIIKEGSSRATVLKLLKKLKINNKVDTKKHVGKIKLN
jgi:hypothetical protein